MDLKDLKGLSRLGVEMVVVVSQPVEKWQRQWRRWWISG